MSTRETKKRRTWRWLGVLLVGLSGLAIALGPDRSDSQPPVGPIVVDTRESATLPAMMTKLVDERVVYVGETHTAYEDHLLQLDVLRGMAAQPGDLALGVEWIQARFQPVVDQYIAGQIDEAAFLRGIEYYERWRFDYRLYRPLVEFARANAIPIIALNASKELTNAISQLGLDGLPEALRAELPGDYDYSDTAYEASLRDMFRMHPVGDSQFQRFLDVQLTWDETMAKNVADYLNQDPNRRMLVLAGKGHVSGRSGIPNRVTRHTGELGVTIGTFDPRSRLFNKADFMVLAHEQNLPPTGIMRVMLDDGDDGVVIKDFARESPALAAGVKPGDVIVAINGEPVSSFLDVKLLMMDQLPGVEVELTVSRDRFFGGKQRETVKFALAAAGS